MLRKYSINNVLILSLVLLSILTSCKGDQEQADGRYFDFASNNNSEASLELEEVVVDGKWHSNATGTHGCGTSNINGGGGISSPPYSAIAPQESIDLVWYSWREKARMKASIKMPDSEIINELLIDPPWKKVYEKKLHRSKIIIDFRPDHKVWIKLAKSAYPESQSEVMILAEGTGVKTNDVVEDYKYYEEDEDYILDCNARRERLRALGYYTAPMKTFNKWYPEADKNKEIKSE